MISDAGSGSEENYTYREAQGVESLVKYNTFRAGQIHLRQPELIWQESFRAERSGYDADKDEYLCQAQQALTFRGKVLKMENGFRTERRVYECAACGSCGWKAECTRAKGNRQIQANFRLQQYRAEARRNLLSD